MALLYRLLFGFLLMPIYFLNQPLFAKTLLVLDKINTQKLPKHFRSADPYMHIKMAGGAQFSQAGLLKIKQVLSAKDLLIIDLRQESHGFLNGNAVSWYGYQNAANRNKTSSQIATLEAQQLQQLSVARKIIIHKMISKTASGAISASEAKEYAVKNISSEADLARALQVNYQRLYVQDHHAPENQVIDQFIQIANDSPNTQWIYFHCRGGQGRTSTFMVMYDILRNAKDFSFEQLLARQVAIGGKDLTKLPDKKSYKYAFAKERLAMLRKFYLYASTNTDHYKTLWSDWLKVAK